MLHYPEESPEPLKKLTGTLMHLSLDKTDLFPEIIRSPMDRQGASFNTIHLGLTLPEGYFCELF